MHGGCRPARRSYSKIVRARMIVDDEVTDGEKIAEPLARLGIVSSGPPTRRQSTGELDYVYDV